MSVTLDNVTLNLVDYKRLTYDESDIPSFSNGYPIGVTPTSFQDIPFIQKLSVFGKMLNAGINRMDLYDANSQVIGNIQITNYQEIYVTAQPYDDVVDGIEYQYGNNAYMPYLTDSGSRHYLAGVKFKAFSGISSSQKMTFTVTLNNETITIDGFDGSGYFIKQVDDAYGSWDTSNISSVIFKGPYGIDYIESLGLLTRVESGVTHVYLTNTSFIPQYALTPSGTNEIVAYQHSSILADNLSFTEHVIEEDGYVNELLNRFSPRFWTNCVGMYMIPASTGSDRSGIESVMKMLQEFDISDKLVNSWVGTDGKEYIINLRWYYGINNNAYVKKAVDRVAMQIGPVLPTKVPVVPGEDPTYYYEDLAISEFAVWHTSELFVAPHFDNYLDMLTSYQLYLPYYGFLSLDPNDVVGARLKVYYNINLFTGHCDIIVTTKSNRTNNKEEKTYSVSCVVGEDIPFTTEMNQSMGLILAQRVKEAAGVLSSYAKGDMKGMLDTVGLDSSKVKSGKTDAGTDDVDDSSDKTSTINQVINVANSVLGTTPKPTPTPARSGNFSAETGTLEDLFPYLLVTRPISAAPSNYEEYGGIPSFKTANLGSINGFTKIAAVAPRSMVDAPKYVNEILSLLQAGVYL